MKEMILDNYIINDNFKVEYNGIRKEETLNGVKTYHTVIVETRPETDPSERLRTEMSVGYAERVGILKKKPNDTGWEKMKDYGDIYFSIGTDGVFSNTVYKGRAGANPIDSKRYHSGNFFSTRRKAIEVCEYQNLYRKLKRCADIMNAKATDFSDRFMLVFSKDDEIVIARDCAYPSFEKVYFYNYEDAQMAVTLLGREIKE